MVAILGLDFTSAPSKQKPITLAWCELNTTTNILALSHFDSIDSLNLWSDWLDRESGDPHSSWIGAFDFPLGQPVVWLQELGWVHLDKNGHYPSNAWEQAMQRFSEMSKQEFEALIHNDIATRPMGDKFRFRLTDRMTRSSSPMKLHYPPVGKMFFQGACQLYKRPFSIWPCRVNQHPKTVFEGYPALLARRWSKVPYKTDTPKSASQNHQQSRKDIIKGLLRDTFTAEFGFKLILKPDQSELLLADSRGDYLDALLCAVEASWAYLQGAPDYGLSKALSTLEQAQVSQEGWIIFPDSPDSVKEALEKRQDRK